jgi:4-hydroxy-tetrahydrodipicolinate synthase
MKQMVRDVRDGDVESARRIDEKLAPLWELDDIAVNPIPIKTVLAMLGHEVGGFRLPLVPASEEERERVRDCLERAGLLAPVAA